MVSGVPEPKTASGRLPQRGGCDYGQLHQSVFSQFSGTFPAGIFIPAGRLHNRHPGRQSSAHPQCSRSAGAEKRLDPHRCVLHRRRYSLRLAMPDIEQYPFVSGYRQAQPMPTRDFPEPPIYNSGSMLRKARAMRSAWEAKQNGRSLSQVEQMHCTMYEKLFRA